MSEYDSSHDSKSESEVIPFDQVIDNIKQAAKDAIETKDYLSYSTLLDIYLNDPYQYTVDERTELMECLTNILKENTELVYEIGWDLPGLFLVYIESSAETGYKTVLREVPLVYKIIKLFELLSLQGNPKELFLKSCELLSTVKLAAADDTITINTAEKASFLKIYCLVELIDSCLRKIKTYYPSRFLSMVVTSFMNLMYSNAPLDSGDLFILKRVFSFARNYKAPGRPEKNENGFSKDELQKIQEDEDYLQRKLLTAFITQATYLGVKDHASKFSIAYFAHMQKPKIPGEEYSADVYDSGVMNRMVELANSFDLDLLKAFKSFIVDSHVLFHSFNYQNSSDDDLSVSIYEKVLKDYDQNLNGVIISENASEIKDSSIGCLFLMSDHVIVSGEYSVAGITFKDSLVLLLRLVLPSVIKAEYKSVGISDIAIFWSWIALHVSSTSKKGLELEIASIPKVLLTMYFQTLLFLCIEGAEPRKNLRYVVLTLLTRVFALAPESVTYEFILHSLKECPFEQMNLILVGILKELLIRKQDGSDYVEEFSKLSTDDSKKPPSLPPRNAPRKSRLMSLSKERVSDLLELINQSFDDVFQHFIGENATSSEAEKEKIKGFSPKLVVKKLPTLSAFLNFLVAVKADEFLQNNTRFKEMIDRFSKILTNSRTELTDDPEEKFDLNAIDMLKIALDRIKEA